MAGKKINPFEHVVDNDHIAIFESAGWVIHLPHIHVFGQEVPIKFLALITICAIIVAVWMIWLGRKMRTGEPPKGIIWNSLEILLFFVRDQIARPGIGEKDAKYYLPYLASLFLFIFLMNLMGIVPFMASPTASVMVTGALALVSFFVVHIAGFRQHGGAGYLKTFIPHIHIEGGVGMQIFVVVLKVGMAALEYLTAFIRGSVLAIRLFANMLAGHTALFMILFFIALVANPDYQIPIARNWMFYPVSIFSVVLVVALTLLEIFIAGLQAFIFTFLTAVYIGLAKHPPH